MLHKGEHSGVPGGQRIEKASWQRQLQTVERLNIIFKGKDLRGTHSATSEGTK